MDMASRTEGFDEVILRYAKEEFLEKGFADASLRTIAQNAGVSTSTIYTRYSDKEGLFRFLVEEAETKLKKYVSASLDSFDHLDEETQKTEYREYADQGFSSLIDILYDYFDEFKLIVKCSPTGYYHDFLEALVKMDAESTRKFLIMVGSESYQTGRINDGFIHVVCSGFYAGLFEVVVHDMPKNVAESYITELRLFYNNGWRDYF
jgi:AcrR family transcriptional regulator